MAVGKALLTIRDHGLYREGFKTFNDYCKAKWGMGRAYAYYLVSGSQVATNLSTRVDMMPPCETQPIYEKQIRPLTILEPDQQCEVWEEAVRSADGKVTSKHVANTVKELTAPAPEPNHPSASHSGFASSGPLRRTPFAPPTPYPWAPACEPWWGRGGSVRHGKGRLRGVRFGVAGDPDEGQR